jgi:hypothetical protein
MMKFLILSALALAVAPAAAFAPQQGASAFGMSSARFSTPVADVPTDSEVVSTEKLRNIAVIAHVDHGKTTLVRTGMWLNVYAASGKSTASPPIRQRLIALVGYVVVFFFFLISPSSFPLTPLLLLLLTN